MCQIFCNDMNIMLYNVSIFAAEINNTHTDGSIKA